MKKRTFSYDAFVRKAIRAAEQALSLPRGWYGTWRDFYTPKEEIRVLFSSGAWSVISPGGRTRHDNRDGAIRKAKQLLALRTKREGEIF